MLDLLRDILAMFSELVHNALTSTPQGYVGVGLIFFYFALIVLAACMRIRRGEHLGHHH